MSDFIRRQDDLSIIQRNVTTEDRDHKRTISAIEAIPPVDIRTGLGEDPVQKASGQQNQSSLIRRDLIPYHTQLEAMGNGMYEEVEVAYRNDIEALPSELTRRTAGCGGCSHYDAQQTAMICRNCSRAYRDRYDDR